VTIPENTIACNSPPAELTGLRIRFRISALLCRVKDRKHGSKCPGLNPKVSAPKYLGTTSNCFMRKVLGYGEQWLQELNFGG